MAIYHLSAQIISRKAGRSSTAAAAYRSAERIVDERTGEIHDYTRKGGVSHTEIVMPAGSDWAPTLASSDKLSPKPSKITAYCSTFLDVKAMPA